MAAKGILAESDCNSAHTPDSLQLRLYFQSFSETATFVFIAERSISNPHGRAIEKDARSLALFLLNAVTF